MSVVPDILVEVEDLRANIRTLNATIWVLENRAERALHHLDCVELEPSDDDTHWERVEAAKLALKGVDRE